MKRETRRVERRVESKRNDDSMTFWEHLDVLRMAIVKIVVVAVLCGVVAFMFKEQLFAIVLAPKDSGFVTYRVLFSLSSLVAGAADEGGFFVQLVNTGLAQQFVIHVKTAMCFGVICSSPYIIYQLFRFVSPALYDYERRYVVRVVGFGYLMFLIGAAVSYFLIFPLTFRFLGTYQVSGEVTNMITLDSYISTLMTMTLAMGIVFEIPILSWLFAKLGFLTSAFMQRYRKHAIVIILIVAAVITPTSDVFTLLVVSLPMYLLYEFSIVLVKLSVER
ncbi:MAG: twin-arginine translocase subunit TatC [Prevotella sp.]